MLLLSGFFIPTGLKRPDAKEGVRQGGGAHWRIPENDLVRRSVLNPILVSTHFEVYSLRG